VLLLCGMQQGVKHHEMTCLLLLLLPRCIQQYFRSVPGFSVRLLLPSSKCLAGYVACTAALAVSYQHVFLGGQHDFMVAAGMHIGVGLGVVGMLAAWVYRTEASTLRLLLSLQRSKVSGNTKVE
jgi:hypothetical protein